MSYGMDYQGSGGGGFGGGMASPPGSAGGGGGGGRARRSYDEQTIQPLTIRMALSARDPNGEGAEIDGRKLYHVKIVGAVRSVTPNSSNVVYDIEDGTGLIKVKQWLDEQNECARMAELREQASKENIYVKVVGQIKDYDGQSMLLADSIRPLSTGNELSHHMLDVVYSGEQAKRKNEYVAPQPMMMNGGVGFNSNSPMVASNSNATGDQLQDAVLNFFKEQSAESEVGANVQVAIQYLGGQYSEGQLRNAIEALSAEGTLYSTIDEEHYKYAG